MLKPTPDKNYQQNKRRNLLDLMEHIYENFVGTDPLCGKAGSFTHRIWEKISLPVFYSALHWRFSNKFAKQICKSSKLERKN